MTVQLLTIVEAAELLRVAPARAYAMVRAGRLPAIRLGRQVRISSDALDALIARGSYSLGAEDDHAGG